jgi:hypothetical protein
MFDEQGFGGIEDALAGIGRWRAYIYWCEGNARFKRLFESYFHFYHCQGSSDRLGSPAQSATSTASIDLLDAQ